MNAHFPYLLISQDANMLLLLLYAVLPIFNPYLWKKTKEQKVRAAAAVSKNRCALTRTRT